MASKVGGLSTGYARTRGIRPEGAGVSAGKPTEDTDESLIHRVSIVMPRNVVGADFYYYFIGIVIEAAVC